MQREFVFTVDRATCASRLILVETITTYVGLWTVVKIEDTRSREPLRYEIRGTDTALHLFDVTGRLIGVFADVAAMVDHAEAVTR